MSRNDEQTERFLRSIAKQEKRAQQAPAPGNSKQKRARSTTRPRGGDWREWVHDDEPAPVERMRRQRSGPPAAATSIGADPEQCTALVIGLASGRARVLVDGEELEARLAPALALQQQSLLGVGDRVALESGEAGPPKVTGVAPRRRVLSRRDPADPRRERVLAANVDWAAVVLAPREGVLRTGLFERIAVALLRGGVKPLLVVNKLDLLRDAEDVLRTVRERTDPEIPVLGTCAERGEGLAALSEQLSGTTAVLVGQSGVGKSTLTNALAPGAEQAIAGVRGGDGKGRHTTTASALLSCPGGGWLIDTPGIRQFGLGAVDPVELLGVLPRLRELAGGCRFADCGHGVEPGCAVVEGAARDSEAARELARYRRMLEED